MKFFHLSDLHIGKQLYHYNLREDQEAVFREVIGYARALHPDAIVIAGDIYDKSVPSAEAVTIFDNFLTGLSEIEPMIPILIISGNHDSAERLEYASGILRKHQIYLAGRAPGTSEERIEKVTLQDEYGEVDFYLLPFLKPSYVRNVFWGEKKLEDETGIVNGLEAKAMNDEMDTAEAVNTTVGVPVENAEQSAPETYSEAVKNLIAREKIDYEHKRNVLVSHQFYVGSGKETEVCDSETFSVGGIDNVDIESVRQFDYVALGHLHGAQTVGAPHIRYCGTLLKYSVSECNHEKTLTVVTLEEKGTKPEIELLPLHPLRDVQKKTGKLKDILEQAREEEREDYISVTLTDERDPYKPKEQLEKVFSHILEVRVENARIRNKLKELDEELVIRTPLENFADFYEEMQGKPMSGEETEIMLQILEQAKEEQ